MIIGSVAGNRGKSIDCDGNWRCGVYRELNIAITIFVASGKGPYGTDAPPGPVASNTNVIKSC